MIGAGIPAAVRRGRGWLADPVRRVPVVSSAMGVLWTGIMLARLFVGGAIGLADNFDGHRLMCQLQVAQVPNGHEVWAYLNPFYDSHTFYGEACSAGGTGQAYYSSEWYFLWLAKLLTPLSGSGHALDLRMLGVVVSVFFGLAIGLICAACPLPIWARVVFVSLIGLFTADSAIAPYFISPLSEPAAIIGMLFIIAALLRLLRRNYATVPDLLLVSAAVLWTVTAKTQTITMFAGVVPAMLIRPVRFPLLSRLFKRPERSEGPTRHRGVRKVLAAGLRRTPAVVICGLLVFACFQFAGAQSRWLREIYAFHQVFETILPLGPDPKRDLRDLGVDERLAGYDGRSILALSGPGEVPAGYREFLDTMNTAKIVEFYATHPSRIFAVLDQGLDGLTKARPDYLGNYLPESGEPPYSHENRVFAGEALFTLLRPVRWVVFPLLWLGSLVLGGWLAFHRRLGAAGRGIGWLLAGLSLNTMAQLASVLLSDGLNDIVKHSVFVVYSTYLLLPTLVAAVGATDMIGRPDQFLPGQKLPNTGLPWPWQRRRPRAAKAGRHERPAGETKELEAV
ncbi:hypothetical protein ORV05_12155 [Amycolatopsis cynarae]|uniref:Glycosyltransferase RgtA/B/C/D-like domain-containing protein n=1 Tax=Amycolatopsis cynarae TaxID=2995223 RepID=A0ABY7BAP7_9PSEU|nr:hypothetical protein [Amycolatopsis sp. HUAS 11-8]WAL68484.1 hypothetical protein ORV05_12155 [Amycolatopsis sp. HUAS 11-8]